MALSEDEDIDSKIAAKKLELQAAKQTAELQSKTALAELNSAVVSKLLCRTVGIRL